MKINRLGSSGCRCARHLARNRATFGRNCSLAISGFFDGLTRFPEKAPNRVMHDMHPAIRQFRRKRPHGQVGFLGQTRQQPVPVSPFSFGRR